MITALPVKHARTGTKQCIEHSTQAPLPSEERMQFIRARQQELLEKPIEYHGNKAEFEAKNAWKKIMDAPEPLGEARATARRPEQGATLLDHIMARALLTKDQEQYLFRQMNYLKFVAEQTRYTLSSARLQPAKVEHIDTLLQKAAEIRNRLIEDNLKLVLSIGKKFSQRDRDASLSVGVEGLMDAVDAFDYRRGIKFSTYATQSIFWGYLREYNREKKSARVVVADLGAWDHPDSSVAERAGEELRAHTREHIDRNLAFLSHQQRSVIEMRYGLTGEEPRTLVEIGRILKLSKQRVAQIEQKGIEKLSFHLSEREVCPDRFSSRSCVAK